MAAKIRRRALRLGLRRQFFWQVAFLRRCLRTLWSQILACTNTTAAACRSHQYRQLSRAGTATATATTFSSSSPLPFMEARNDSGELASMYTSGHDKDSSDLVSLKISILGDCHIGKTSFLRKYVGRETQQGLGVSGLNRMDKTLYVKGARIAYSIWEVEGDENSQNHIPTACKDSVAMLFVFDLTSRCTLNSVIDWYMKARKWNQNAIPVLIGTKFDDFVQLPMDLQWTIASQARAYARALNATLFFSSATYNINVNKVFKFITAKLFNLSWTPERNLTIGEPIIDF